MPVSRITSGVVGSTTSGSARADDVVAKNQSQIDAPQEASATGDSYAMRSGEKSLSSEDQALIAKLAARDREVRAHEAAHQAAGGGLVGGASFSYQNGPDGKAYAVGGEVSVASGAASDPQATIAKMDQVRAAALAPASPSGQDRAVAAQATAIQQQARAELAKQRQDAASGSNAKTDETSKPTAGSPVSSAIKAFAGSATPAQAGAIVDVSA